MCVCVSQELVSEKLRTQQMNNDLEKLTHELEKIGLNKERLLHDEGSDDRCALLNTCTLHHNRYTIVSIRNTFLGLNFWRPNWSPL